MDLDHNLILGCNLCSVFSHIEDYELKYPSTIEEINKVDFIIIRCKECNNYILIIRDHTEFITNEMFGRTLYLVKKLFNSQIKMDTNVKHCSDHFHCHIDVNVK